MIAQLTGLVAQVGPTSAVIEVGGLGIQSFDLRHSFPDLAGFPGCHRRFSAGLPALYVIRFPVATGST